MGKIWFGSQPVPAPVVIKKEKRAKKWKVQQKTKLLRVQNAEATTWTYSSTKKIKDPQLSQTPNQNTNKRGTVFFGGYASVGGGG